MAYQDKGIQVVILPFHCGQGHFNTMLQFAKRLAWKGVNVTIVTTTTVLRQMPAVSAWESITVESIYDDVDEPTDNALDFLGMFEARAASNLAQVLVAKQQQAPANNRCLLVYHFSLPWARQVAVQSGVLSAAFSTVANASFLCYYGLYLKSQGKSQELELPATLPPPDMVVRKAPYPFLLEEVPKDAAGRNLGFHPIIQAILDNVADTLQSDMVLVNSFDELEKEALDRMSSICQVKTIGPTIPSVYLDNRIKNDVVYGFNNSSSDDQYCINWLNTKPNGSVVYVAFGSIAHLSAAQMAEIAEALKQSTSSFLWVVRESEQVNLPSSFVSETLSSGKGLVVPWCKQLEVLAHSAVGCFISHCGWNSTVEAVSFGVPVLAMPQFFDQLVDAHLVDQVWGVGIVASLANEDGLVVRQEIERCLEEIMRGPRGREIKEKATMWKALAKEASDEGGSSDKHIDEIIEWLASS